jgi:hypothetical protein
MIEERNQSEREREIEREWGCVAMLIGIGLRG